MTKTERKEAIIATIKELSEEEQKILTLYYHEGLSLDEIAEVMHPENKAYKTKDVTDKQ
jgi:DNA-directed RNA polymerase specialized sigma subunit